MVASNRPLLGDGFFAHLEMRIKASHVRFRLRSAKHSRPQRELASPCTL